MGQNPNIWYIYGSLCSILIRHPLSRYMGGKHPQMLNLPLACIFFAALNLNWSLQTSKTANYRGTTSYAQSCRLGVSSFSSVLAACRSFCRRMALNLHKPSENEYLRDPRLISPHFFKHEINNLRDPGLRPFTFLYSTRLYCMIWKILNDDLVICYYTIPYLRADKRPSSWLRNGDMRHLTSKHVEETSWKDMKRLSLAFRKFMQIPSDTIPYQPV
jgi:hypothetical protein